MTDYYQFLRNVYFFRDLADEEIRGIEQVCHEEEYGQGRVIFEEGAAADRFYIVLEGAVEVWKDFQLEEKDLLAVHEKGHLFGEMALVDDLPRSATVVAREKSRLLYVNRDDFTRIITENSSIALSIIRSVSSMVRQSNETFVEGLRERNRELEEAYRDLKEAQDELLRAERLSTLGKFSSLILHDIKNPLSILRGYAELIVRNSAHGVRVQRNAEKIIQEADRLNRLANELLDYSRGEIRLNISIVDLQDFCAKVVEAIAGKFRARSIDVETEVVFRGPVLLDEERMFCVFLNLAENSRKAMSNGGTFGIRVSRTEGSLCFTVYDTGVGMSPEVQQHIFEPFYSHSSGGGTGLGMSIVKSIVEAHDGSLSVESKTKGGTTFAISVPLIG